MADVKQAFLQALNDADIPDGIKTFLQIPIPAPPASPGTVEQAIIATGALSSYCSAILAAFQGLTPIDLLLHAGQKNATLQSIAISGLELTKATSESDFAITSPGEGSAYGDGTAVNFVITIISGDVSNAAVVIDASTSSPLQYQGDRIWKRSIVVSGVSEHEAVFTVKFTDGYSKTKSVAFSMDNR